MYDKELLVSFSVDCHSDNVSRVRNLLVDLGMTSIIASENHIRGVCEMGELQEVMRILSKEKHVNLHQEFEVVTGHYNTKKVIN